MAIYYILLVNKEPHSETSWNYGDHVVKEKLPQDVKINTVLDHLVIQELQSEMDLDNTKRVYQISKKLKLVSGEHQSQISNAPGDHPKNTFEVYQEPRSNQDGFDGCEMSNDHRLDQHYNNDGQQVHKEQYPQVSNVTGLGLVNEEPQPEMNVDNTGNSYQINEDLQLTMDNTTDIHLLNNKSKRKMDNSTISVIDSSANIPLTNEEPPSKINTNDVLLSNQEPDCKKHSNISVASVSEATVGEARGIGGFSPLEKTLTEVRKIADNPLAGEGSFNRELNDVGHPLAREKSLSDMNVIADIRMQDYSTEVCNVGSESAGCASNKDGVGGNNVDQKGDGRDSIWKYAGRLNFEVAVSCEQSRTSFF